MAGGSGEAEQSRRSDLRRGMAVANSTAPSVGARSINSKDAHESPDKAMTAIDVGVITLNSTATALTARRW